jgi:hypothetical protein
MNYEYKDLLNALVEMQASHHYAARKSVLISAEHAIVNLEQRLQQALAKIKDLEAPMKASLL